MASSGQQLKTIRVIVASPGDVAAERKSVSDAVAEVNGTHAHPNGFHIDVWKWETDAYPGLHLEGPQGAIDEQMQIGDADIVIGIFWKRFGTPVSDAGSGTAHELRRAEEAWKAAGRPQVWLYFSKEKYSLGKADLGQVEKVLAFKEESRKKGLSFDYDLSDFPALIRGHLASYINDRAGKTPPAESPKVELPYPWLTRWIGRDAKLQELRLATREEKLVVLHGTGGVGKTRLAIETARKFASELPRDVVFVPLELRRNEEGTLLSAVRDALGVTEVDAPDFDALRRAIGGGDRLLILDNFESVMAAVPEVPTLATIPGVRLLVTSQRLLDVGESVVELDPMATLDSFLLFRTLAKRRDAAWEPDDQAAMDDVLEFTDGLPYLIEIVAARAPYRPLRKLAEELKTKRLAVEARPNMPMSPRHRSVQACLEWAVDHLGNAEKEALPKLSVFAGGFEEEAARDICGTPTQVLVALVDAALLLLDRQHEHYSMLATTREFARTLLSEDIAARHAAWYIDRLDLADDDLKTAGANRQRRARGWITANIENIETAIEWAEENDFSLFARAIEAFESYLDQQSRFGDMVRLTSTLTNRLDPKASPDRWAMAQNNLGVAYWRLPTGNRGKNLARAIACYEAALRVFTETDFPKDWAMTQNNLGIACAELSTGNRGHNLARAIACFQAALRVYTETDFPKDWATMQNNLGLAWSDLPAGDRGENVASAIACFEAALRVYTESDFPLGWATTHGNLGIAWSNLPTGDPGENLAHAIDCYRAAFRVYTESDFPLDWAAAQNNLGTAWSDLPTGDPGEDLARAIDCFQAALRVYTETDFPLNWATTQGNLASAYEKLRTTDGAETLASAIACYEAAARGFAAAGFNDVATAIREEAVRLREK